MTTYQIKAGQYLVIDLCSASGGVTYEREKTAEQPLGEGYEQEIRSHKIVDHAELIRESDALVQAGRTVLAAVATRTVLGWIADGAGLQALREGYDLTRHGRAGERYPGFDALRAAAADLDERAKAAGSARRVRIDYCAIALETDNVAAAREIARTVRETCEVLASAVRTGDPDGITRILARSRNLDQLAVGMQRDAILYAIGAAKAARRALRAAVRNQPEPAHARLLAETAATLDVEALDACVGMFADFGDEPLALDDDDDDEIAA